MGVGRRIRRPNLTGSRPVFERTRCDSGGDSWRMDHRPQAAARSICKEHIAAMTADDCACDRKPKPDTTVSRLWELSRCMKGFPSRADAKRIGS